MAPHHQPYSETVFLVPQTTYPTNTTDSEPMTAHPGHPHHLPYHFCDPTPPIINEPARMGVIQLPRM